MKNIEILYNIKIIKQLLNSETKLFLELNSEYILSIDRFTIAELNAICNILKYDMNRVGNMLEQRMFDIKTLGRDSSSERAFYLRYGILEGKKRFIEKCKASAKNTKISDYIKKYGEIEGKKRYHLDRSAIGLDNYIRRYGRTNGIKKWNLYLTKFKKAHSLEGYIEKYGEIEGKIKWNNKLIKYKFNNSLEGYIKKYGEIEGKNKWEGLIAKRAAKLKKSYIIDTYGDRAQEIIKNRFGQTTLKCFIKRLGQLEGKIRYDEYVNKLRYTSSYAYIYDLHGKEKGDEIIKKKKQQHNQTLFNNKSYQVRNYSLVSQDLFWSIYEKITNKNTMMFYTLNKEFFIYDKKTRKVFAYDFFHRDKIIEFHGDYYHANPKKYQPNYFNKKKCLYAKDIWEADRIKENVALDNNKEILIVWQDDFVNDPDAVVLKCLNFLK